MLIFAFVLQCTALSSLLPAQVFLGRTALAFWDAQQDNLVPACRIEPESADDVSTILKTVVEAGCHFAIKSGGHDRTAGSSNADGGVTIDLVKMGEITIEPGKKSVKVGAGARWKAVYDVCINQDIRYAVSHCSLQHRSLRKKA